MKSTDLAMHRSEKKTSLIVLGLLVFLFLLSPAKMAYPAEGPNNRPIINSLIPEADTVLLEGSTLITATASDPDGDFLSYVWSTSGGTITGDADADPETITWTAPAVGGDRMVAVTVSDGNGGQSSKSVFISVTVGLGIGYIGMPGANPVRIDTDSLGQIYVSDTTRDRIIIYDAEGNYLRAITGLDDPLGIALGPGDRLYVGENGKDRISMYNTSGTFLGVMGGPVVQMPNSIAVDHSLGKVIVADSKGAQVLVYNTNGSFQLAIDGSSAVPGGFIFPVGVAIDPVARIIYVSDAGTYQVHGMDYAGNSIVNFGSRGIYPGEFNRLQGVGVDGEGRIFAVDSFQSRVHAFNSSGQYLAIVGSYGQGIGELSIPLDAHVDAFDRLLVSSNDNSRIEIFALTDVFTPPPNYPPTEPTPDQPGSGAEVSTLGPTLVVLAATDLDGDSLSYEFEITQQGQPTPHASVEGIEEDQGEASWTVEPPLADHTFYEWKARATDGLEAGPWSASSQFYVNLFNDVPSTPPGVLTLPGAELRPDGVLEWEPSTDPDALDIISYTLEIDDDPDFSSILIREADINGTSISLESLTDYALLVDDTTYYWRVKAVDDKGAESGWAQGSFYFNRIEIEIGSDPADARIYIDGNAAYPGWEAGVSPATVVDVEETLHIVTLIKEGYKPYTEVVDNRAGADAQINAVLVRATQIALVNPRVLNPDNVVGQNVDHSRPFMTDWNFDGIPDILMSDDSGRVYLVLAGATMSYQGVLLDTLAVFGYSAREAKVFAVDWDNDSDFDLLIGTRGDGILLAINEGDQETPAFVDGGKILIQGSDPLGSDTALVPAVMDWNDDGKKDLLVGGSSGHIGLYINSGTDEAPQFLTEEFVEADGAILSEPSGYSAPVVGDWNSDGLGDLLVGTQEGTIYLYLNIGIAGAPAFAAAEPISYYLSRTSTLVANPGPRSVPYFGDWNADGKIDLILGNAAGRIIILTGYWPNSPVPARSTVSAGAFGVEQ
jgi:sugar lactone lactonase YvrE